MGSGRTKPPHGPRRGAAWAAAAGALLGAAWLSPRAIPYNMDEFVHYHALGCAGAVHARELPTIRDGCGYYDLRPPLAGRALPLRSYLYIGSVPALPFYPFFKLVADPRAVRIAGACCFLLSTLLAARLARVSGSAAALAALVFPVWLTTFLIDQGPVGLSAALVLAALLAVRRALEAHGGPRAAAWAAGAGFALFLGLWTKLVFAWWIPLVLVGMALEARRAGPATAAAAKPALPALALFLAFLVAPTGLLLASTDRDGRPYLEALRQGGLSAGPEEVEAVAVRLARYLEDGALIAPRNVVLPASPVDGAPLLLAGALLAAGAWRSERRREVAAWALVAALTFAFVSASGHSRWPHHFAFPLLPLALALALAAEALDRRERLVALGLAAAFWASIAARLPSAHVPLESSAEKDRLLAFVRERGLDREALQVHASWGTYYIAQLFGDPARAVLYARRVSDDPARLRSLADVAVRLGRPLLLVSSRRWERLHTPAVEAALGQPRRTFRFGDWWAVEYRPPPGS
jgi:hypothetical protein